MHAALYSTSILPSKHICVKDGGHLADGMQGATQMTGVFLDFRAHAATGHLLSSLALHVTSFYILLDQRIMLFLQQNLIPVRLNYMVCGCDSNAVDSAEVQWICGWGMLQASQEDLI